MSRYAEKTTVSIDRSKAEIEKILRRYAHKVRFYKNGCWEGLGTITDAGYGSISVGHTERRYAHRVFYEAFSGLIPDGLDLDHLCRNRSCVNPCHLEPVTRQENLRRGQGKTMRVHLNGTCIRGHKMSPDNTYVSPKGCRQCRICNRIREARRSRNKEGNL